MGLDIKNCLEPLDENDKSWNILISFLECFSAMNVVQYDTDIGERISDLVNLAEKIRKRVEIHMEDTAINRHELSAVMKRQNLTFFCQKQKIFKYNIRSTFSAICFLVV